jgi:collagenase-like PrtC family protease
MPARAANFTPDELPAVMSYLRTRGVKGYVALNVLVFDEELGALEARARQIARAGVDAVIVQVRASVRWGGGGGGLKGGGGGTTKRRPS